MIFISNNNEIILLSDDLFSTPNLLWTTDLRDTFLSSDLAGFIKIETR